MNEPLDLSDASPEQICLDFVFFIGSAAEAMSPTGDDATRAREIWLEALRLAEGLQGSLCASERRDWLERIVRWCSGRLGID